MEWAKGRPRARIDLAGSNLAACRIEDLPGAADALDLSGESPDGFPPLVEAIASAHGVAPDRVATGTGCSGANFLVCAALLEPGDEVLVESPTYDPLPAAAKLLGAVVRTFPRRFEDGWDLDPSAIAGSLTARTRLVMISNPHNPSGTLASPDRLAALAEIAARRNVPVLFDEVYRDTLFEDRPEPAATLSPFFVSTSSLTKAYGLASLRCGWAIASPEIVRRVRRARDLVDVWGPIPSDRLALAAFRGLRALSDRARRIVEPNRERVSSWLEGRSDLEGIRPRATLAFPRLKGVGDARGFVEDLFERTGTAVAPGHFFGAPAHFRIAFGGPSETVAAGLEALDRALDARLG